MSDLGKSLSGYGYYFSFNFKDSVSISSINNDKLSWFGHACKTMPHSLKELDKQSLSGVTAFHSLEIETCY